MTQNLKTPRAAYHMTLRDYTRVLFRQKAVIILCILVVSATVYVGLKLKSPIYQASAKMLISAKKQIESPYYSDVFVRDSDVVITQSEIVKSNPVLERVVNALKLYERPFDYERQFASPLKKLWLDYNVKKFEKRMSQFSDEQRRAVAYLSSVEQLRSAIRIEPIRGSSLFLIHVMDYSPYASAVLANVVSRSYVIFDLEQQLAEVKTKYTEKHQSVQQLEDSISQMERFLDGHPLPNVDSVGPASVKIVEQATIPLKPSGFSKKLAMLVGVVFSVFLGLMLAFLFEWLDQSFRSRQDLENFVDMPVLACINKKKKWREPSLVKDPINEKTHTPRATSYRVLSEQLHFILKTKNIKTVLITSVASAAASALIAANLGLFLSKKLGHRVLLIDANLRKPSLHKLFLQPQANGLSELLESDLSSGEAVRKVGDNLDLVTTGASSLDPGILLDTVASKNIFKNLAAKYSVVIVDSADLRDHRDSAVLSSSVDGVIVVVDESGVRKQVVRNAIEPLHEKNAHFIGVVMNNRDFVIPKIVYDRI